VPKLLKEPWWFIGVGVKLTALAIKVVDKIVQSGKNDGPGDCGSAGEGVDGEDQCDRPGDRGDHGGLPGSEGAAVLTSDLLAGDQVGGCTFIRGVAGESDKTSEGEGHLSLAAASSGGRHLLRKAVGDPTSSRCDLKTKMRGVTGVFGSDIMLPRHRGLP